MCNPPLWLCAINDAPAYWYSDSSLYKQNRRDWVSSQFTTNKEYKEIQSTLDMGLSREMTPTENRMANMFFAFIFEGDAE